MSVKTVFRVLLALIMIGAGIMHFTNPMFFVRMVPALLGDPLLITWVSGGCELLLGAALLWPRSRKLAGLGLIALYVAVLPANLNMALHPQETGAGDLQAWMLWARLPLQLVLMAWAWWVSRPEPAEEKQQ